MVKIKDAAWIVFIGSLWGLNEMIAGDLLYSKEIPLASVWLSAMALFLLSAGRAMANWPGSSTAIGTLACLFRFVNAGPFLCHLLGIFMLGLAFDIVANLLSRPGIREERNLSLIGILSAYGGHTLFAFIITYAIRYPYWVDGGVAKVFDHIFFSGSLLALMAIFLVPLGFSLGQKSKALFLRQPGWSLAGIFLFTVLFWIAGQFAG